MSAEQEPEVEIKWVMPIATDDAPYVELAVGDVKVRLSHAQWTDVAAWAVTDQRSHPNLAGELYRRVWESITADARAALTEALNRLLIKPRRAPWLMAEDKESEQL